MLIWKHMSSTLHVRFKIYNNNNLRLSLYSELLESNQRPDDNNATFALTQKS